MKYKFCLTLVWPSQYWLYFRFYYFFLQIYWKDLRHGERQSVFSQYESPSHYLIECLSEWICLVNTKHNSVGNNNINPYTTVIQIASVSHHFSMFLSRNIFIIFITLPAVNQWHFADAIWMLSWFKGLMILWWNISVRRKVTHCILWSCG